MSRSGPDRDLTSLAQRIMTYEAARVSAEYPSALFEIWEKIRRPLSQLAGADGFCSLSRRALVRARVEVPALNALQVMPDGTLAGLSSIGGAGHASLRSDVLIDHLLILLAVLIGKGSS